MENVIERGRKGRRNGGHAVSDRASELKNLVADVEDLVKKVADVDDAEIAAMRAKVEQTLARAKSAATESFANIRDQAREATEATDEYVHESPWTAIGVAAAVGVLIGFIASRR